MLIDGDPNVNICSAVRSSLLVFFLLLQKVEFTTAEGLESKEFAKNKVFTGEELGKQLDRLLQDKADNQRIRDWVEVCGVTRVVAQVFPSVMQAVSRRFLFQANMDEQQSASNQFVRALMTSVCQSAIICKSD